MTRRKVKNTEKSPRGQCLTRPVPNGRRSSSFWLGRKTQKFSGTNQKSERQRPFGTGLVRRCPQELFSPFFTFLRAIFFGPFRLSFAPTICPWVSKDGFFASPSFFDFPFSTNTTTTASRTTFSSFFPVLLHHHHITIVFPPPPSFYCFPFPPPPPPPPPPPHSNAYFHHYHHIPKRILVLMFSAFAYSILAGKDFGFVSKNCMRQNTTHFSYPT